MERISKETVKVCVGDHCKLKWSRKVWNLFEEGNDTVKAAPDVA